MAQIAVAPVVLKDMILTIATDSYELHVNEVLLDPSTQVLTWQGGTPSAVFTDVTNATWTCKITGCQDWTTANGLASYCLANAGQKKTVVFKPLGATTGKPVFTVDVYIVPMPIGGKINSFLEATVTMGCAGAPVKTAAP